MKRRQLLAASGVVLGLAGCLGDGGGSENGGESDDGENGGENGGESDDGENGGENGGESDENGGESDENGEERNMSQEIPAGAARNYFEAQKELDVERARELLHSETLVMLPDNPEEQARAVDEYTILGVDEDPSIEAVMDHLGRYEEADEEMVEPLLEQGGALVTVEVFYQDSDSSTTTTVFLSLENGLWKVVA